MASGTYATLWTSRSNLERILLAAVAALIFVISVLLITLGESQKTTDNTSHLTTPNAQHPGGLCLSQECISVAATILSDIDPTVKPCEDFYKVLSHPYTELQDGQFAALRKEILFFILFFLILQQKTRFWNIV